MLILHIFPPVLDIDCHKGTKKKKKKKNEVEATWGLSVFQSAEGKFP